MTRASLVKDSIELGQAYSSEAQSTLIKEGAICAESIMACESAELPVGAGSGNRSSARVASALSHPADSLALWFNFLRNLQNTFEESGENN